MAKIINKILKNKINIIIFIISIVFLLLAANQPVLAEENLKSWAGGIVGLAVATIVGLITYLFTAILGLILTLLINILVNVSTFSNIIEVDAVKKGWVIVRDLCNMFFILILLIIAFATILRQENYSAKKMLPKLLIMAVLINFSKTIFGLIIDFAQIIMLTFVNGFAQYGRAKFVEMFNTNALMQIHIGVTDDKVNNFTVAGALIAGLIAIIITIIVVLVMLAVLIVRIVMLWVYTILSPLIFLGFAFPPIQKYTGKIWEDFSKQVIVGPILAFFIWLALFTAHQSSEDLGQATLISSIPNGAAVKISDDQKEICGGINDFFCNENFQRYIITIALLMGGLMVTQQMGGAAASIAGKGMGALQSGRGLAWKGTKKLLSGDNYLARKAAKATGWDFRPIKLAEAWKAYSEENKKKDESAIRSKAGENFEAGGIKSVLMGMGSKDYFNRFLGMKGLNRARQEIFTNPKERKKLGQDIDNIEKSIQDSEAEVAQTEEVIKPQRNKFIDYSIKRDEELKSIEREMQMKDIKINSLKKKPKKDFTIEDEEEMENLKNSREKLKEDYKDRKQIVIKEAENDFSDNTYSGKKLKEAKKELDEKRKELKSKSDQIINFSKPVAFESRSLYRKDIEDAKAKYKTITNSGELLKAYNDAEQRGDKFDMAALFEKLENDANGNELLRSRGYASTAKGVKAFLDNEVNDLGEHNKGLKGAKFSPQEKLQIQNDYGEAAERVGHWDMAKLVGINSKGEMESLVRALKDNTGALKRDALGRIQYDDSDHATAAYAEVMKMDPQKILNSLNRLAMGGEDGRGKYQISNLGKMIYRNLASGGIFEAHQGRLLSNTAANLSSPDIIAILKEIMKDDPRKGNSQIKIITERGLLDKGGGKPDEMIDFLRVNGLIT
jgi:hypothetical protein